MKKSLVVLFVKCLLASMVGVISVFGQQIEDAPKDKKITLKLVDKPLAIILTRLMVEHDIQIGFEESVLDEEHYDYFVETDLPYSITGKEDLNLPNSQYEKLDSFGKDYPDVKNHLITIDVENKSLAEVFDSIVAQMENYSWEINDGVFNIYPKKDRNPLFENLLKLNIKNFNFKSGTTYRKFRDTLFDLPEVKQFFTQNNLDIATRIGSGSFFRLFKTEKDINFSNLTFKELLNKITKIKKGGWRLVKSKKTVELYSKEKTFIQLEL